MFLKSGVSFTLALSSVFFIFFILKHDKFRFFLLSFQIQKKQIWEGEKEPVPSRQRLLLQLLLVIAAFILQTQWMLW